MERSLLFCWVDPCSKKKQIENTKEFEYVIYPYIGFSRLIWKTSWWNANWGWTVVITNSKTERNALIQMSFKLKQRVYYRMFSMPRPASPKMRSSRWWGVLYRSVGLISFLFKWLRSMDAPCCKFRWLGFKAGGFIWSSGGEVRKLTGASMLWYGDLWFSSKCLTWKKCH